jgi:hypothetical protein
VQPGRVGALEQLGELGQLHLNPHLPVEAESGSWNDIDIGARAFLMQVFAGAGALGAALSVPIESARLVVTWGGIGGVARQRVGLLNARRTGAALRANGRGGRGQTKSAGGPEWRRRNGI